MLEEERHPWLKVIGIILATFLGAFLPILNPAKNSFC